MLTPAPADTRLGDFSLKSAVWHAVVIYTGEIVAQHQYYCFCQNCFMPHCWCAQFVSHSSREASSFVVNNNE